MLGSTKLTAILGSGLDNTDHEAVRAFIRTACAAGLALMLVYPDSKRPADMRSPQARRADDKAAREAARAAGRADWESVKSGSGLELASTDAKVVLRYFDHYVKVLGDDVAVNLAVEVGRSRLVVVDCDTAEQVARWMEVSEAPPGMPPTVSSPGQIDQATGEWVHRDGGHFYFTVPEGVELPSNPTRMTWGGEHGFAVLWDRAYVLIPPSRRPEGAYELVGREYPLPPWLADRIIEAGQVRAARAAASVAGADAGLSSAIDAWAATVRWADVLGPLGWTPHPRADSCGCEVWTAPGPHGSPKSATAHDEGCQLGRYTATNAPLHIWTDNPGEPFDTWIAEHHTKTITKLQAVACSEFDGSIGKAMDVLGVVPDLSIEAEMGVSAKRNDEQRASAANLAADIEPLPQPEPGDAPEFPDEVERPDPDVFSSEHRGLPRIAPFSHWRDMPPPEYVVAGLIEHGGLSSVIGPPGVGKSTVVLDLACHIATGRTWHGGHRTMQTRVLYLPGEGLSGAVQRIRAWEDAHELELGPNLLLGNSIIMAGAHPDAWAEVAAYIARQGVGLVIFDTFARMALGVEENSATEVGRIVQRFDQIRQLTNAGVLVVHHTSKAAPTVARGSNALNGALDSELLVSDGWSMADTSQITGGGRALEIETTKQKNSEPLEQPLALQMISHNIGGVESDRAPLVVGANGNINPMEGDIVLARPAAEPLVETAIRIMEFAARFPQQGVTRANIVAGVEPDSYARTRRDEVKYWKVRVDEAVDRALRYSLLDTLTGTPSGSRYIPGVGTVAAARAQAAAEVLAD